MIKFYEDIAIGDRTEIGSYLFTAQDIKTFARAYDPQPFHIDEEAARHSHFGALCASGWHTAAIWMRLTILHRRHEAEELMRRGETVPPHGPSPGFRKMRWLRPVHAGDTVSYTTEVHEKRASISRPQWGLVTVLGSGANQRGEPVISFLSTAFVGRRMQDRAPEQS
jgi:acyl dehydratase